MNAISSSPASSGSSLRSASQSGKSGSSVPHRRKRSRAAAFASGLIILDSLALVAGGLGLLGMLLAGAVMLR